MYIPNAFRVEDIPALHGFMQEYGFATLVTAQKNVPFATHLPMRLDTTEGDLGVLRGHVARANPQWQPWTSETVLEALAIFHGPHAYISPGWYETHPSVPTWNYAVVHAYGVPRVMDDEMLHRFLSDLTDDFERGREKPWGLGSVSEEYLSHMKRAVVGFEIPITRLEGKFKLSQNRSQGDQQTVAAALAEGTAEDQATAEMMHVVQNLEGAQT